MAGMPEHRRCWAVAILAVGAVLSGCTAFDDHRNDLVLQMAAGRYDRAAHLLDSERVRDLYQPESDLLWKLERGAVALATGETELCIGLLEQAEREIELRRERSLGDEVVSWALNDRSAAYVAEPYEDIYINVLKLLAQLKAGRIVGGATVEARRLGSKADVLRDTYLRYEDALESRARSLGPQARSVVSVNRDGEFIESTLGTYLAAITFMKSGNPEFQRVAGKRLVDAIGLQSGLIGPVRAEDFVGLDEMSPEGVDVLVVALSGRGPTKYADRVGPIPLGTWPLYFELPRLATVASRVASVRLEVRPGAAGPVSSERLRLVEDLSSVAAENHRRMLPLIYTRTLVRYAAKAGLAATATEVARRGVHDDSQVAVQVAGALAGLAFLMATERADLRCWASLPGQAHVATLSLPDGVHEVRVVYESSGGAVVHATPWEQIKVRTGGLTSVVTHYWN